MLLIIRGIGFVKYNSTDMLDFLNWNKNVIDINMLHFLNV